MSSLRSNLESEAKTTLLCSETQTESMALRVNELMLMKFPCSPLWPWSLTEDRMHQSLIGRFLLAQSPREFQNPDRHTQNWHTYTQQHAHTHTSLHTHTCLCTLYNDKKHTHPRLSVSDKHKPTHTATLGQTVLSGRIIVWHPWLSQHVCVSLSLGSAPL